MKIFTLWATPCAQQKQASCGRTRSVVDMAPSPGVGRGAGEVSQQQSPAQHEDKRLLRHLALLSLDSTYSWIAGWSLTPSCLQTVPCFILGKTWNLLESVCAIQSRPHL